MVLATVGSPTVGVESETRGPAFRRIHLVHIPRLAGGQRTGDQAGGATASRVSENAMKSDVVKSFLFSLNHVFRT